MARLVRTPDGVTHSFPDGTTDEQVASALEPAYIGPGGRPGSGPPRKVSGVDLSPAAFAAAAKKEREAIANMARDAVTVGSMFIPGLGEIGAGSMLGRMLLGPLTRMAVAGGTAALVDPLTQAGIAHEAPTMQHALGAGRNAALAQGVGEPIAGAVGGLGDAFFNNSLGFTRKALKENPAIADVAKRERIPVGELGKPNAPAGQAEIGRRAAANAAKMKAIEGAAQSSGVRYAPDQLLSSVDSQIADLRQSTHPDIRAQAGDLQAMRDAWASANPNGLDPVELDRAVRESQGYATPTYTKDAAGKKVLVQTTPEAQTFHRLFAQEGRAQLRGSTDVGPMKDRAKSLINLQTLYRNAETAPATPLSELANPLHAGPTILRRTLLRPDIASRAGLALNNPATTGAVREAPLAAYALLEQLLAQPARRDAVARP